MRAIAAAAGVDPAMVFYFFGTKQGELGTLGERVVRTLLENLDKSDRTPLVMLTRSAPTDPKSEALLREFIDREITGRIAALLGTPDALRRASMVNVQILGLAVARYIVRVEPIASASVDELVASFGPLVQHCLTG
ncbi:TetR/AcrR family transcriptional regulator [Amycolatopsis thailandensis]|uniref:TetR/AcrR family transcriptional regulator n=1 Tax=Amycolatopsis thailandensis TaxID=589330 RepID=UPI003633507A